MRRIFTGLIFLISLFFVRIYAADIPQPVGWINDFTGVISSKYKEKLNNLISELEEKTSAEIAVVTINSIAPYDEKEYARLLFDNWKPGKKGKDNGVLVLLAIKERRWRIETGYGVEGILPDGLCGEIGRNYMVPLFKEGRYGEGLYNGVARIVEIIAQNANITISSSKSIRYSQPEEFSSWGEKAFPLIVGLILLTLLCNWLRFLVGIGLLFLLFGFPTGKLFFIFVTILFILKLLFRRFIPIQLTDFREEGHWGGGFGGGGFGGGGFGGGGFGGGGGGGGGAGGGF